MTQSFELFPIEQSVSFIMHLMDREFTLGLQKHLKKAGFQITPEQLNVLGKLWEEDGMHQSELAKRCHKDRHNMTRIVNLLEKKGLVNRKPDRKDKRLQRVWLSKEGRMLEKKLVPIVETFLNQAFQGLSKTQIMAMQQIHLQILSNLGYSI